MDPFLLTLAGTAGTTVVTLLVGEGWQQARDGVVAVWRRFRPEAAGEVERELDASRLAALEAGDSREVGNRLEGHWAGRFAGLLGEHPEAADDLRTLLDRLSNGSGRQAISGGVRMEARADGSSRIYQSARDQHITER
jgi:hypothetical protein